MYSERDLYKCEESTHGRLVSGYCRRRWVLLLVGGAGEDSANVIVGFIVYTVVVVRSSVSMVVVRYESTER